MIRFSLICKHEHEFEGWFANSGAFEDQLQANDIACPECGSCDIHKTLMAPSLAAASVGKRELDSPKPVFQQSVANPDMVKMMRAVRDHVKENAEYVGPRFADEARKIHYKEVEPRGIYGEASRKEISDLKDDGIDVHPMPVLPEDQN